MGSGWIDSLDLISWGAIFGAAGLLLLGESRKVFFENPRALITLEVWFQVALKAGAPGYLAMILLLSSAFFVFGGIATLAVIAFDFFT